jgi:hypothetical protein
MKREMVEACTLPRLVFREFSGDIIKFDAIPQLCKSFFLFGMLFTLAKCIRMIPFIVVASSRIHALTKMWRTLILVAALSFALPDSPSSLLFPLPLAAEEDLDGILIE